MQNQAWASGTPAHDAEPKIDENTPPNCAVVSIDFEDGHARLLMDGLTYGLTAQQCGMLAYILAETVKILAGVSDSENCRLNRPWFPRHSPSSENSVSHTLLATAA